jgi:hypothetical protein
MPLRFATYHKSTIPCVIFFKNFKIFFLLSREELNGHPYVKYFPGSTGRFHEI